MPAFKVTVFHEGDEQGVFLVHAEDEEQAQERAIEYVLEFRTYDARAEAAPEDFDEESLECEAVIGRPDGN